MFGDSLSAGYGLPQNTAWPNLLQQRFQQNGLNHSVINASISGETTQGGLYRIEEVLRTHQPKLVILELGANDGLRGYPIATTYSNLETIIKTCQKYQAKVLLIGMRLPPNFGPAYTQQFENVFIKLAKEYRLTFVPFLLAGLEYNRQMFLQDGVHPTVEAQPLILENVWNKLQPNLKNL